MQTVVVVLTTPIAPQTTNTTLLILEPSLLPWTPRLSRAGMNKYCWHGAVDTRRAIVAVESTYPGSNLTHTNGFLNHFLALM